jgi:hypothetical protein
MILGWMNCRFLSFVYDVLGKAGVEEFSARSIAGRYDGRSES